jgi:hypothetical protein
MGLHSNVRLLSLPTNNGQGWKRNTSGERSSLSRYIKNYCRKNFYSTDSIILLIFVQCVQRLRYGPFLKVGSITGTILGVSYCVSYLLDL